MSSEFSFLNMIDRNCAIAITSFKNGEFTVYYDPEGCMTKVNIDQFKGFVFHPFQENNDTPKLFLQPSTTFLTNNIDTIKRFISSLIVEESVSQNFPKNIITKEDHINLVRQAVSRLNGDLKKVVLSRIEEEIETKDPLDILAHFCRTYPENGNYLFYSKESGLWLGSSPEILIDIEDSLGKTCALAGTKSNHDDWTSKEMEEQKMVEEYINNTFHLLNIPFESHKNNISLKGIDHIKTNYSFKVDNDFKLGKLLGLLHPTPAVAGVPKSKAIEYIEKQEAHDRKYYTGYFGYIDRKVKKLFVNLRCLQMDQQKAFYYLGGGITKDSVPENEYLETLKKKASLTL